MKNHFIYHVLLTLAIIVAFGTIVMLLWNILMPDIFGVASLNFWQALGLLILARLLLGGISSRFWMNGGMHAHRNPIREKWMKMTPQERKEFIFHRHHMPGFGADFFNTEKTGKEL